MSYLKDILEGPTDLKDIVVQLFALPFWLVTIFMFNPTFYKENDIIIILALAFVLNTIGVLAFVFFIEKIDKMMPKNSQILNGKEEVIKASESSEIIVFFHIGYSCFTLFLSWLSYFINGEIFYLFTYLIFYYGLLFTILCLFYIALKIL